MHSNLTPGNLNVLSIRKLIKRDHVRHCIYAAKRFTSKVLRSPPWLGWPLWNDHGYVPLVVNTSRSFPHSWFIIGFVTRLTRQVLLVEQELLTLLEHLSSPSDFSGVLVTRSCFMCMFCRSLFILLFFFFWPLCCLFFFDIQILITPLVSSNSSYKNTCPSQALSHVVMT